MSTPTKVIDLELTRPLETIEGLDGYEGVQALMRVHGAPVGQIRAPVTDGRCAAGLLFAPISRWYREAVARELLYQALARPLPDRGLALPELLEPAAADAENAATPRVSVAVCTRDRPADLKRCLEGLLRLDYPALDLLVIDNAPKSDITRRLLGFCFPSVRYVHEPRPGLNWARNRAVQEARGEIVAFTDDDVVVDPGWVRAFARLFAETPEVMAATGLVAPYELESEAQLLFEHFGAFGQGFSRRWGKVDREAGQRAAARYGATGGFGTGANMAFRRSVFSEIGLFDPALDVGTATNGGGDLEFLFRVLKEGHTLVREPRALVRHRHRAEYEELRRQLATWGTGLYSHVLRSCEAYPEERAGFLWMTFWWLGLRLPRRFAKSLWRKRFPHRLLLDEVRGIVEAPSCYRRARRAAEEIEAEMGGIPVPTCGSSSPALSAAVEAGGDAWGNGAGEGWRSSSTVSPAEADPERWKSGGGESADRTRAASSMHGRGRSACRERKARWTVELTEPLPEVIEAAHARRLEIDIRWRGRQVGETAIAPAGKQVRTAELRDAIADTLAPTADPLFRDLGCADHGICIPALLRRR